jgi:hypothetical protein
VKKYFLFLLVAINGILAFGNAGKTAIGKKGDFSRSSGNHISPAVHVPNAEMEIFTAKAGPTSQANHSWKKLFGNNDSDVRNILAGGHCNYQHRSPILPLYVKSYLSHIYPSHNFW